MLTAGLAKARYAARASPSSTKVMNMVFAGFTYNASLNPVLGDATPVLITGAVTGA